MGAGGYESWFFSARDPASPRALWIRHTRDRPLSSRRGAYEYGTREPMPGITPRPLPEG